MKQRKGAPKPDVYPPGWSPNTAAQKAALESPADILFFGGAAGSLKTETMLVYAARESNNPNLRAIIFRHRRKILAVYLDPSNFKHIGDGHTIADQINEVLEPYDLGVTPASNDRIGGWQLMYQMLQTGELQIADTCPKLIEALPSPDARRKEARRCHEGCGRPIG